MGVQRWTHLTFNVTAIRSKWQADRFVASSQLVTGVLVITYLLSTILRRTGTTSVLYDDWVSNLAYGGCTFLCAWRAVRNPVDRVAWAAIAFSLALFTAGSTLWTTVVQYWNPVPYPSISDAFFLVFYPVAYFGVALLIRNSSGHVSGEVWLDGIIAALGVAALEATLVISVISHGDRGNAATVATNLAYPIGDLVLVMMLVSLFAMQGWRPPALWWTLGLGFVLFAAADTVYVIRVTSGTYVTGTPLDGVWPIGTFFIALAAWQVPRGRRDRPASASAVIPGLFLLSSLVIVVGDGLFVRVLPLGVALATAALVAALIRLALSYRQLRTLAQTQRDALTDELTGLGNRRLLGQRTQALLEEPGTRLAMILVDLDRFKEINDAFGHPVGDELLTALGGRLRGLLRQSDVLTRLGGDEFAAVLANGDSDHAIDVAQRIVDALQLPFELSTVTASISASIGIALAPEHADDIAGVLRCADVAMYKAKNTGTDFAVYTSESDSSKDRFELLEDLRSAIRNRAFVLFYQPQFDLESGRMRSVEALLRWPHPTRGFVPPDAFIPLAEDSRLIRPLTEIVLDLALRHAANWQRQGIHLPIAVNLSAINLLDDHLPAHIRDLLASHGIPANQLVVEITETALMVDPPRARRVVGELHQLGVEISVDDFGTGYSSLAYLRNLAVDELKLDRSFLQAIDETGDGHDAAIAESVVHLGHALGLRVVAEGVENATTLAVLTAMGFDAAQGYFLGVPVPPENLHEDSAVNATRRGLV